MARFFSHRDIKAHQLPRPRDIQWLAGQIAKLPPFQDGCAVLCGSVCWGSHSHRSDIDIAHFSTRAHPHIEAQIAEIVERFALKSAGAFIAPRVDVITIGVESSSLAIKQESGSGGKVVVTKTTIAGTSNADVMTQPAKQMFAETVVRFSDHIGSLARLKGGAWAKFHQRYLSSPDGSPERRREAIRNYVSTVMSAWDEQPLHPMNSEGDDFTPRQLDLIGQAENFPMHLMRRILGELGQYPQPDRASDVRQAFAQLKETWSEQLLDASMAFTALDAQYEALIADCKREPNGVSASEYQERVRSHVDNLSFARLQEAMWQYLKSRAD